MALGRIILAVEFCDPLTVSALADWFKDSRYKLVHWLVSGRVDLSLAYPLPPPGGGLLTARRRELLELAGELSRCSVGVGFWPVLCAGEWMPLIGRDYYFAGSATARIFEEGVRRILELRECPQLSHVLIDLEPPQFVLSNPRELLSRRWRGDFASARRSFRRLAAQLGAARIPSVATFFPPLIVDQLWPSAALLQRLAGVAVFGVGWDYYAPLYYTTFAERYLKLSRPLARRVVLRSLAGAAVRLDEQLVPFLGTLGPGLMAEPDHMADPFELEPEIREAASLGMRRLAIYNLEGILYQYSGGQPVGRRSASVIEGFFDLLAGQFGSGCGGAGECLGRGGRES